MHRAEARNISRPFPRAVSGVTPKEGTRRRLDNYDVVNRLHRLLEKEFGLMPVVARKVGAGSEKESK